MDISTAKRLVGVGARRMGRRGRADSLRVPPVLRLGYTIISDTGGQRFSGSALSFFRI